MSDTNSLGQPIGDAVPGWTPRAAPSREPMVGRYCRLEILRPDVHAESLFHANSLDREGAMWTYLPYGPFPDYASYLAWLNGVCGQDDPMFFAIVDADSGRATGVASYLRIDRNHGAIEVGHLAFSPLLQRTRAATEAMYLMMKRAFAQGYRRYEWKCNALNAASRRAAERLGISFEGIFRQAAVLKGRSRDTAWYAAIDREWPALEQAFLAWLHPDNFDSQARQRRALSELTRSALKRI